MATSLDFIEYVQGQADLGAALSHKKMFGEYALYYDGKVVGFACDNTLYLKPTEAGRALLSTVSEGHPYPGAKRYFVIDHALDEPELLRRLIRATADELPLPRPKSAKAKGKR